MSPADLHRATPNEKIYLKKEIEAYLIKYAHILIPILFVIMLTLFVMLCFALVGVSAVESGTTYNHIKDVI